MEFLKNIQNYFESMDQRRFYRYTIIFTVIMVIILAILMYYYHRKTKNIQEDLQTVNTQREQVRTILQQSEKVKYQKNAVNAMLTEDENFKISGYFDDLLKSLGLWDKRGPIEATPPRPTSGQAYGESTLTAQLTDITMQDLVKLLEAIEQKKRIYTKDLEITTAKKMPRAIDVILTIATLQPIEQPRLGQPTGE